MQSYDAELQSLRCSPRRLGVDQDVLDLDAAACAASSQQPDGCYANDMPHVELMSGSDMLESADLSRGMLFQFTWGHSLRNQGERRPAPSSSRGTIMDRAVFWLGGHVVGHTHPRRRRHRLRASVGALSQVHRKGRQELHAFSTHIEHSSSTSSWPAAASRGPSSLPAPSSPFRSSSPRACPRGKEATLSQATRHRRQYLPVYYMYFFSLSPASSRGNHHPPSHQVASRGQHPRNNEPTDKEERTSLIGGNVVDNGWTNP